MSVPEPSHLLGAPTVAPWLGPTASSNEVSNVKGHVLSDCAIDSFHVPRGPPVFRHYVVITTPLGLERLLWLTLWWWFSLLVGKSWLMAEAARCTSVSGPYQEGWHLQYEDGETEGLRHICRQSEVKRKHHLTFPDLGYARFYPVALFLGVGGH